MFCQEKPAKNSNFYWFLKFNEILKVPIVKISTVLTSNALILGIWFSHSRNTACYNNTCHQHLTNRNRRFIADIPGHLKILFSVNYVQCIQVNNAKFLWRYQLIFKFLNNINWFPHYLTQYLLQTALIFRVSYLSGFVLPE